jgi:hypothetical protein
MSKLLLVKQNMMQVSDMLHLIRLTLGGVQQGQLPSTCAAQPECKGQSDHRVWRQSLLLGYEL